MKAAIKWIISCVVLNNLLADLKDQWNELYKEEEPELAPPPCNSYHPFTFLLLVDLAHQGEWSFPYYSLLTPVLLSHSPASSPQLATSSTLLPFLATCCPCWPPAALACHQLLPSLATCPDALACHPPAALPCSLATCPAALACHLLPCPCSPPALLPFLATHLLPCPACSPPALLPSLATCCPALSRHLLPLLATCFPSLSRHLLPCPLLPPAALACHLLPCPCSPPAALPSLATCCPARLLATCPAALARHLLPCPCLPPAALPLLATCCPALLLATCYPSLARHLLPCPDCLPPALHLPLLALLPCPACSPPALLPLLATCCPALACHLLPCPCLPPAALPLLSTCCPALLACHLLATCCPALLACHLPSDRHLLLLPSALVTRVPCCPLPLLPANRTSTPAHCTITDMSLKRTHVDSESIQDGQHIQTRYNLRPLKLPSCSPGILVAASKAGHQGTSMIGTAHTWHTFQKIPNRLQISGRVDGGGGLRVEEEADLNREAPSSPLTKYSYSDEPSKPAHSKKRTKKLPQPPPPPPPPKCLRHSQPNTQIPALILQASRQACVVCDVTTRKSASTATS
ncbi:hypothetical protein PCASD_14394 [Puccinia coronata f. sp. avenae]|uniref:Uncharacterized protein n=1 Tax=Puccinia coronata f. sp. avenae TaxID=200324 RepID=A0A2N5U6S8_9BASI|nr:hypothetical protein PCASD_14394 [Puccinia coronata f. sp. avenae]